MLSSARQQLRYKCVTDNEAVWHDADMAILSFDTHDFFSGLQESGVPEEHAKAIADGLKKIDLQQMATKLDLQQLELRLLRWLIPMALAQVAAFAAIVKWL